MTFAGFFIGSLLPVTTSLCRYTHVYVRSTLLHLHYRQITVGTQLPLLEHKYCQGRPETKQVCGIGANITNPLPTHTYTTEPKISSTRLCWPVAFGMVAGREATAPVAIGSSQVRCEASAKILRHGALTMFAPRPRMTCL